MTDQVDSLVALYWAGIGSVAAVDYIFSWNALSDGLSLSPGLIVIIYLAWFVTLLRSVPEHLEVALR